MKTSNLIILVIVAGVLGAAAYFLGGSSKPSGARLNGKLILPGLDVSAVAKIEVGDKLKLAAGDDCWTVESYQGYPADRAKIAENLLKLTELKVGQTARGKTLDEKSELRLRDAAGKEIAALTLGAKHPKYGHGRYLAFEGETVLVTDTLDAFDGDPKRWIETKIVDEPWISFNRLADPALTEADLGFATGAVAKVTIAGDTNRVITVGNVVKGGSDRYVKLDGSKWIYEVSSYSVEKFLPKPEPKEEAKPEVKAPEAKPEKKAPEAKAEPEKLALPESSDK